MDASLLEAGSPPARVAIAIAAALALAACSRAPEGPAAPAGLGRAVASGPVRAVSPSADGAWVAVLDRCAEVNVPSLPPGTASCALSVAPAGGGERVAVASAVTTLPQGILWSRSGAMLAALSEYDYPSASGTLVVWRDGAAPRRVAERVTFFGFGAGGELGYVAAGRFGLVRGDGSERAPGPPGEVATFEIGPKGAGALDGKPPCGSCAAGTLVRRTGASGGALLELCCGPATVATSVTEYAFAPDGARLAWVTAGRDGAGLWVRPAASGARPARVATGAQGFAFARDGSALAFVSDVEPGRQGDLHLWAAGKDTRLAREVGEYRWASRAPRLVWLERYDPRVRAGTVGAGGVELPPRAYASHVTDAAISADGRHVAFLRHTTRGGYTIDLGLAHLDAAGPPRFDVVGSGVFGFAFSPDGAWLYYQTRCVGEAADACDLERIPAGGLAAGAKPEAVAQGVAGFEFAPDDAGRLLLTWRSGPRGSAVDVGVWRDGKLVRVDARVRAGTARFAGPGSRRLVYVVADEARAGAYVADLP